MAGFNDLASDGLVRHNISLMRYDAKLRRQIRAQLRRLQQSITDQLGSYSFADAARKSQLERLLKQVDDVIKGSYKGMNKFMAGEMGDLAIAEHHFGAQHLNSLFGVDLASANLSPAVLRALSKDANVFGAPAAEHWGRQSARLRQRFADQMREGFLLGESTGDLVRRVRGTATGAREMIELASGKLKSVNVFSGGIMDVTTKQAEALVRTSVSSISNEIRLATYEANTDVIGSVQASVTLDRRTSDICIAHGAGPDEWSLPDYEPVGGSNNFPGPPPWHFNCRTTLIPITKSWQQLQKQGTGKGATRKQQAIARKLDNNAPKRMKASLDGHVPRSLTYPKWLKTQPVPVQKEVLGAARYKLWKSGKLDLGKTLDQTGRPLSLKQMGLADAALGVKPVRIASRRAGLTDAYVAPPQKLPKITNAGLADITVGQEFMYLDSAYKAHKITAVGVEALPWSTRTGKYVTARNRKTLKFKAKKPIKPVKPTKPTKPKRPTTPKNPKIFGDVPEGVVIRKADDFEFTGTYTVKIPGHPVKRFYRDPETGFWNEDAIGLDRIQELLGFNAKEAMAGLLRKYPVRKGPIPPPVKPTTTAGMPKAPVVKSADYRSLKLDDIFKDTEGNVWKVYGKSTRGVKVLPWSTKSNRFLAKRNGRTLGYTAEKAKTVKQFKQSTANATQAVKNLFMDHEFGTFKFKAFSATQKKGLEIAQAAMGKNGFNKVLAEMLGKKGLRARIFNMGKQSNLIDMYGGRRASSNVLGSYWSTGRALGMADTGNITRMAQTWVHEFGHHMDYSIFRASRRKLLWDYKGNAPLRLSASSEALLKELDDAYKAMITEYRAASKAVGKELGIRLQKGVISPGAQKNNWGRIERVMKGRAQSSYSLHNEQEWFAETFAAYFNQGGSNALLAEWQPSTYRFFQTMFSKDLEPLWKEMMGG